MAVVTKKSTCGLLREHNRECRGDRLSVEGRIRDCQIAYDTYLGVHDDLAQDAHDDMEKLTEKLEMLRETCGEHIERESEVRGFSLAPPPKSKAPLGWKWHQCRGCQAFFTYG